MNAHTDPTFTVPRAMLRAVAEVDAAYGWHTLPAVREPRVLDIGAGVGAFAVVAHQVWPDARLHCHEPDPESYAALVENTRGLPVQTHAVLEVASLPPCDVLRLDTRASDVSMLLRYPHLMGVSVLFVTTHGEGEAVQARSIAGTMRLTTTGQHAVCGGGCTFRFVRTELLTRVAADETPLAVAAAAVPGPDAHSLQARDLRSAPGHLYVSLVSGPGKGWSDVEHCLHVLGVLCQQRGVGLTLTRERMTGVDRARNMQTERCLDLARTAPPPDKPTHMLHLDTDLVFNAEDILKLMRTDLDVTAIVYPRKEIDWDRVVRAVHAGVAGADLHRYAASFVFNSPGGSVLRHPEIGTLLEVEEAGTGCLMIKVDALARYVAAYREELEYISDYEPYYAVHHQFFHCERDPVCPREMKLRELKRASGALLRAVDANRSSENEQAVVLEAALAWSRTVDDPSTLGRYLTEDYSFCRRWRMLGGKIYALMEAEVGHIGKHLYRGTLERAVPIRDVPFAEEE